MSKKLCKCIWRFDLVLKYSCSYKDKSPLSLTQEHWSKVSVNHLKDGKISSPKMNHLGLKVYQMWTNYLKSMNSGLFSSFFPIAATDELHLFIRKGWSIENIMPTLRGQKKKTKNITEASATICGKIRNNSLVTIDLSSPIQHFMCFCC